LLRRAETHGKTKHPFFLRIESMERKSIVPEGLRAYVLDVASIPNMVVFAHNKTEIRKTLKIRKITQADLNDLLKDGKVILANI
jgi:hypothetical protein